MKHLKKFVLFGIVGGSGVVINNIFLFLFVSTGVTIWIASALATEVAIISNFFGNHYFTFKDVKNHAPLWKKFLKFQFVSFVALIVTVAVLTTLVGMYGQEPAWRLLFFNMIAIAASFLINFILNLKYTWAENSS